MRSLTALSLATLTLAAPVKRACFKDQDGVSHCTTSPATTIITDPSLENEDAKALSKRQGGSCWFDPRTHCGQCIGGQSATAGVTVAPEWPEELGPAPAGFNKKAKRQSCHINPRTGRAECIGGQSATSGVTVAPVWPEELGPAPAGFNKRDESSSLPAAERESVLVGKKITHAEVDKLAEILGLPEETVPGLKGNIDHAQGDRAEFLKHLHHMTEHLPQLGKREEGPPAGKEVTRADIDKLVQANGLPKGMGAAFKGFYDAGLIESLHQLLDKREEGPPSWKKMTEQDHVNPNNPVNAPVWPEELGPAPPGFS